MVVCSTGDVFVTAFMTVNQAFAWLSISGLCLYFALCPLHVAWARWRLGEICSLNIIYSWDLVHLYMWKHPGSQCLRTHVSLMYAWLLQMWFYWRGCQFNKERNVVTLWLVKKTLHPIPTAYNLTWSVVLFLSLHHKKTCCGKFRNSYTDLICSWLRVLL